MAPTTTIPSYCRTHVSRIGLLLKALHTLRTGHARWTFITVGNVVLAECRDCGRVVRTATVRVRRTRRR